MAVGARKVHRGSLNNLIPTSYCCILSCLQGSQKTVLRLTGLLKTWTIAPFSKRIKYIVFAWISFQMFYLIKICSLWCWWKGWVLGNLNSPTISAKSALLMCDYRDIFGVSVRHLRKPTSALSSCPFLLLSASTGAEPGGEGLSAWTWRRATEGLARLWNNQERFVPIW